MLGYCDRLEYGLSDGRKTGAYRLAAFMAHDIGLSDAAGLGMLETWNSFNAPPLADRLLHEIHANARRYGGKRGAA